jgi:LysM repeat protein
LIVVVLVLLLASAVLAGSGGETTQTTEYRVQSGDTLWGIATAFDPTGDTRARVYEIRRLNELDNVIIHPGDVLLVPVAG